MINKIEQKKIKRTKKMNMRWTMNFKIQEITSRVKVLMKVMKNRTKVALKGKMGSNNQLQNNKKNEMSSGNIGIRIKKEGKSKKLKMFKF